MLEAIDSVETYLTGVSYEDFLNHSMMRFACIKQIEIVGEASVHLSTETKSNCSIVEWQKIKGMRNVFVHEYFGIDPRILWEIATEDLPELKTQLSAIVQELDSKK
jgi:uncharacterized protein with HEPN domain